MKRFLRYHPPPYLGLCIGFALILLGLSSCAPAKAQLPVPPVSLTVAVNTNGVLLAPANFFSVNSNAFRAVVTNTTGFLIATNNPIGWSTNHFAVSGTNVALAPTLYWTNLLEWNGSSNGVTRMNEFRVEDVSAFRVANSTDSEVNAERSLTLQSGGDLTLQAETNLYLNTPGLLGLSAQTNSVLTLLDPTTGRAEWRPVEQLFLTTQTAGKVVSLGTSKRLESTGVDASALARATTNALALPISVRSFGAVGDGVTDDAPAFQAALNSITNRGVVLVPEGTYKLNSGLTVNVTRVRLSGHNAKLDFSGLATNATGITITGTGGDVAAPYYQVDGGLSGLQIQGPGSAGTSRGLYIHTATEPGPSHIKVENCNLYGWAYGIEYGNNAYLTTFDNVDIHSSGVGVWLPLGISNSGEGVRFYGGTIYNLASYAFRIESIHAFVKLIGTSIDYNFGGILMTRGRLDLLGAHFESIIGQHLLVPAGNEDGIMPIINMHGGLLYRGYTANAPPQDSTNAMVDIRGRAAVTITGCEIHDYVAQVPKIHISNTSSLFLFGGRMIYNPAYPMLENLGNSTIACWDWNGGILESAAIASKNTITAVNSIVATNQLVGGSVLSRGGGEFATTLYAGGAYVTNNLVGNGPSFFNSTLQVASNLTVVQSLVAGGVSVSTNVSAGGNVIAGNQVQGASLQSSGNVSAVGTVYATGVLATNNLVANGDAFFNANATVVTNLVVGGIATAQSGVWANANRSVVLTNTGTWYSIGAGTRAGLFALRDHTSGGGAVVFCDQSAAPAYLHNGIGGFEFRFDSGQMQARVTNGTAPRTLRWSLLQTNDN